MGLIAIKFFLAWVRKTLPKYTENQFLISTGVTALNILLTVLVITAALHFLGMRGLVIWRLLIAIALVAIGFVVLLRPYIPTLPFKIGNTVEIGGLIGKVEAMTFTYTRVKTFEGKTLFIPNQMLFKTIINNFHLHPDPPGEGEGDHRLQGRPAQGQEGAEGDHGGRPQGAQEACPGRLCHGTGGQRREPLRPVLGGKRQVPEGPERCDGKGEAAIRRGRDQYTLSAIGLARGWWNSGSYPRDGRESGERALCLESVRLKRSSEDYRGPDTLQGKLLDELAEEELRSGSVSLTRAL